MNVPDFSVPIVSLIFSAAALAVALLSAALSFRTWQATQDSAGGEPGPRPMPEPVAEYGARAWHGNVDEGYVRGQFTVKRMPTRGAEAWRGNDTEWVAYAEGARVAASPDLADVLAFCEGQE